MNEPTLPDNSKIEDEQTSRPSLSDTANYTSVLGENIYEFMTNSYFGTGGYRDGSYLIAHSRELFYDARRDNVFYKNYTQPIINATVNPIFAKPITREITKGDTVVTEGMAVEFLENVDNAGTSMQHYMNESCSFSTSHGVTFLVVDNHKKTAKTIPEALEMREYPYVYRKLANQVPAPNKQGTLGWKTDKFGNLEWITFLEDKMPVKNIFHVTQEKQSYSYWDNEKYQLFTLSATGQRNVIEEVFHGLNQLPVIPYYSTRRVKVRNILPMPPYYDIAKLNHAIFNKDSEIRDQERAQGFAVFYVATDSPGNMNIGAHNVIGCPMDSPFPPGFAAPDANILKGLVENGSTLRDDLYRIAEQKGVIGVQSSKSGVALEWEFTAEDIILSNASQRAEAVENKIMELFQAWTGEEFTYNAEYPHSFKPASTSEDIELIDKALLIGMPPKAKRILQKVVFKALTSKEDSDNMDDALAEFDTDMETEVVDDATDNG